MTFKSTDIPYFKQRALQWASSLDTCCYLDSEGFCDRYSKFDTLIAVGASDAITAMAGNAFESLSAYREKHTGWLIGFLGYDLKNEIENLNSQNTNKLRFPDLYFFAPLHLILIFNGEVKIISNNEQLVIDSIRDTQIAESQPISGIQLRSAITKQDYHNTFENIRQHIGRGDIYVTNFCQEFFSEEAIIDPLDLFNELRRVSPTPFSSFFKYKDQYILCASPERFLAKRGNQLISQPIKGTARRGKTTEEDEAIKTDLRQSIKEQQENVMIVDLVRNDLTRSAQPGTVKVDELFGIYSFEQVHQMISTVTCEIGSGLSAVDAIRNTFPMGSMTGAPKLRAMQLMEQYEQNRRGIYSGAIGYFSPDDDFDFNVVIRTVLYNAANQYLSFQVGSAITYDADADQEYTECLLKAKPIMQVLGQPLFDGQP